MTEIPHSFWRGYYTMWTHWELSNGCIFNSLQSPCWATGHTQVRLNSECCVGLNNRPKNAFEQGPADVQEWQKAGSPTQQGYQLWQTVHTVPAPPSSHAMNSLRPLVHHILCNTDLYSAGHAMLRNGRRRAPFTKRILCLLQIYNLNASIHNTDLFKICLFYFNFQMSLKVYWPTPKSTQNTENIIFSENTLSSQWYLLNSWSGTRTHRPQINNPKLTVWGQGSLVPNCGNRKATHTGLH